LPEASQARLDERKALRLMAAQPSMIKRPVLEIRDRVLVGFKPESYAELLE
jgi:arsenate reductase-like glutaredoxin family protein